MRLPLGFQAATGGAGFQVAVADCAGSSSFPVQYPSNICGWTVLDSHGPESEESQVEWALPKTTLDSVGRSGRCAERQDQALGLTSLKRAAAAPDIPTVEESGVKGFAFVSWCGLWGPKSLPADL